MPKAPGFLYQASKAAKCLERCSIRMLDPELLSVGGSLEDRASIGK